MALQKTNGQTTPKAPSLGSAAKARKGSPNVAKGKGKVVKASSGKMASVGPKLGTTYGNHSVGHPLGYK